MIYPLTDLEAVFRAADIEGLIARGAPDDEYDSEAAEVQAELEALEDGDVSHPRVSTIITHVWQDSFGPFNAEDWRKREHVLHGLTQQILEYSPVTPHSSGPEAFTLDENADVRRSRA